MFMYFLFHLTEKTSSSQNITAFSEYEMMITVEKPANPRTYENDYYFL